MTDILRKVFVLKDLFNIAAWQDRLPWRTFREGVEIYRIYRDGRDGPAAALLRFSPGAKVHLHEHLGFEHIFVLSGSQIDQNGELRAGSLMIHPPGTRHRIISKEGCIVLAIYEKSVQFLTQD